ncbi:MAG: hypothetical protein ACYDBQ_03380 [Thermoplasmatota archaeon]
MWLLAYGAAGVVAPGAAFFALAAAERLDLLEKAKTFGNHIVATLVVAVLLFLGVWRLSRRKTGGDVVAMGALVTAVGVILGFALLLPLLFSGGG